MRKACILALGLVIVALALPSRACTNFLITKGASADGSCMISYSADSHTLYGELYHWAAAEYPEGAMLDIYEWDTGKYLGKIKQARKTFNVVGNMNENQVAIGETTYGGREELVDTAATVDYGSLMYIALQRATTAREAIKIMTDLVAEYGYYSEGESFSISDANEVWIMEMIGKGKPEIIKDKKGRITVKYNKGAVWVARRIPDGYISGHANQARITTFPLNDPENCLYSPDVITFARAKGWFSGDDKDFSFSDTYAPVNFEGARFCEARVWSAFNKVSAGMDKYLDYAEGKNLHNRMPLYVKPDHKLTLQDVFGLMRDYYQNTPLDMTKDFGAGPYGSIVRWRPLTWKVDGVEYCNERAVSTQQTGFSFIAQSRSWIPNPLGGIIWFGVDDTYSTVYTPMYTCMTRVPETYAVGNGSMMSFSDNSAFWTFNQVSNFAYTRYNVMIGDIQKKQSELENYYMSLVPEMDKLAKEQSAQSQAKAVQLLTEFSVSQGNNTVHEWKNLYAYLFTRYMDGNIKTVIPGEKNPKVSQPGYSEDFYRNIVKETGEKFKVIGTEGQK
ncbi:MAG: C69 family dipeptidase [Bacteroidetes bacterium]|nr:C69 family dipeptidase [Bacteroidota bacterium]